MHLWIPPSIISQTEKTNKNKQKQNKTKQKQTPPPPTYVAVGQSLHVNLNNYDVNTS